MRKDLLGLPHGMRAPDEAYTLEARCRIYAELGVRAAQALREGSVVVDATFGDPGQREAFLDALDPAARTRLRLLACEAPLDVRIERARERLQRGGDPSDAGPDVVRRLSGTAAELPGVPRLEIDTTGGVDDVPAHVAAWVDAARVVSRNRALVSYGWDVRRPSRTVCA